MTFQIGGIKDWQCQLNVGTLTSSLHPKASYGMGPGFFKPVNAISYLLLPNPELAPFSSQVLILIKYFVPQTPSQNLPLENSTCKIKVSRSHNVFPKRKEREIERGRETF